MPIPLTGGPPSPTRDRIVEAARRVMDDVGLARATTKEIARAAGCSEATLYKYFASKEELFLAVLRAGMPTFGALLTELAEDPGTRTTEQALAELAREATAFFESTVPLGASLFAEPALLRRQREVVQQLRVGPHMPLLSVAGYLRAEIGRGRLPADADPDAAAAMLLGACFHRAFIRAFMNPPDADGLPAPTVATPPDEFATNLAAAVYRSLT
jgi:AcrR family transcriptional regulator